MAKNKPVLAVLGAGKLGITLTRLALHADYAVYVAGSGPAEKIALSVTIIAPGATATTAEDAVAHADVVVLALPLGKYRDIPPSLLDGKLVIDAMNYWWEVDGGDESLAHPATSSSEGVQQHFAGARIIKAFSHMGYHHLHDEARPVETPGRKAIAIAGDHDTDTEVVAALVNDLGFDPVIIGGLATGKILEPGNPLFGANVEASALRSIAGI